MKPQNVSTASSRTTWEIIEKVSYGPFVEPFAREKAEGWDVWGNQVDADSDWELGEFTTQ
ncbi:MAG: hypothetical protein ACR2HJ_05180 [Fimbriimonadales bacterium]